MQTPHGTLGERFKRGLDHLQRFGREVHRRALWQTLAVFLGASFAVLEAVDLLIERIGLPDSLFPLAFLLLALGLPVVLLTAYLQGGDEGELAYERRTEPTQPGSSDRPPVRRLLTWRNSIAGGVLAFALWGVIAAAGVLDERTGMFAANIAAPVSQAEAASPAPLPSASVAVLYFDDFSEGEDLDYLAQGLTEALIHELAQVPALRVISRNGVKPFKDPDIPIDSIARVLQVGSLVEGSVERFEDQLRVTVQLIDGNDGSHLMSRRVERSGSDLLRLRDDVVAEVVRSLRARLGEAVHLQQLRSEATSDEAWSLVQQAEHLRSEADALWSAGDRDRSVQILEDAESLLARAEALDPDWAEPSILRGLVISTRGIRLGGEYGAYADSAGDRALAHVERVLARWPNNATALGLRGSIRARMWEHEKDPAVADALRAGAERDLRRAVELEPDQARAWAALSRLYRQAGDFPAARVAAERAYDADAYLEEAALVLFNLCHISIEMKAFVEARRWCAEGEERFPEDGFFIEPQLLLLASDVGPTPDLGEARVLYDRLMASHAPADRAALEPVYMMYLAAVLARAGQPDSARSIIRAARSLPDAGRNPSIDYYEANVRLRLGEPSVAIRLLASYVEASPGTRAYLARDWWWEDLADQPGFADLVEPREGT